MIRASSVNWRADHSSPIVEDGNFELSSVVDAVLSPANVEIIGINVPSSLDINTAMNFLSFINNNDSDDEVDND